MREKESTKSDLIGRRAS